MNSGSDATPVMAGRVCGGRRPARGAALTALFARLGGGRTGTWLETELRADLKRRGIRTEDGLPSLVRRALALEIPEGTTRSAVVAAPEGPTLLDVLAFSAARLATRLPASRETLARALVSGATTGTTPVADGIALPHARLDGLSRPRLVLVRCRRGLATPARAGSGMPAAPRRLRAILVLVGPADRPRRHLRLLAGLAARADNPRFLPRFLSAPDADALREVLLRTAPRPSRAALGRPGRRDRGPGSGPEPRDRRG